jgi:hypothetical protein
MLSSRYLGSEEEAVIDKILWSFMLVCRSQCLKLRSGNVTHTRQNSFSISHAGCSKTSLSCISNVFSNLKVKETSAKVVPRFVLFDFTILMFKHGTPPLTHLLLNSPISCRPARLTQKYSYQNLYQQQDVPISGLTYLSRTTCAIKPCQYA